MQTYQNLSYHHMSSTTMCQPPSLVHAFHGPCFWKRIAGAHTHTQIHSGMIRPVEFRGGYIFQNPLLISNWVIGMFWHHVWCDKMKYIHKFAQNEKVFVFSEARNGRKGWKNNKSVDIQANILRRCSTDMFWGSKYGTSGDFLNV